MLGTSPSLNDRRHQQRRQQNETSALVRFTHQVLDATGYDRSPSWVSRTVRSYQRHGADRCLYGTWLQMRLDLTTAETRKADFRYLLGYADPTGEAAIRAVMKEAARA